MIKPQTICALGVLALSACTGPVIMGTDAAITVATKPWGSPPADTADQIPDHASWCYVTMGEPQCYAHPQNTSPDRLINVDPQNLYPLDATAYRQAVAAKPPVPPASGEPVALNTTAPQIAEKDALKEEINADTLDSASH
jgi:hypothetical protein